MITVLWAVVIGLPSAVLVGAIYWPSRWNGTDQGRESAKTGSHTSQ